MHINMHMEREGEKGGEGRDGERSERGVEGRGREPEMGKEVRQHSLQIEQIYRCTFNC